MGEQNKSTQVGSNKPNLVMWLSANQIKKSTLSIGECHIAKLLHCDYRQMGELWTLG